MIYLPDTNAFSAYLAGRSPPLTQKMLSAFKAGELRLSVIVLSELAFGAEKVRAKLGDTKFARRVDLLRKQIEPDPLGKDFPDHYARVRTHLESTGRKMG